MGWIWELRYLLEILILFLLNIYLQMGLLDYMVALFIVLKISLFFIMAISIHNLTNSSFSSTFSCELPYQVWGDAALQFWLRGSESNILMYYGTNKFPLVHHARCWCARYCQWCPWSYNKNSLWGLHVPHIFVVWLKNEWSFVIETMHVRP